MINNQHSCCVMPCYIMLAVATAELPAGRQNWHLPPAIALPKRQQAGAGKRWLKSALCLPSATTCHMPPELQVSSQHANQPPAWLKWAGVPTSSTTGMPRIHQALKLVPAAGHSATHKAGWRRQASPQVSSMPATCHHMPHATCHIPHATCHMLQVSSRHGASQHANRPPAWLKGAGGTNFIHHRHASHTSGAEVGTCRRP